MTISCFSRVDAAAAGPEALGILIPPGKRTLIIVRPKALPWDLLPARWDGDPRHAPAFCDFTRDEAPAIARRLVETLEQAVAKQTNLLESFGDGRCYQIWLRAADLFWIVCTRSVGDVYRPAVLTTQEEAAAAGAELTRYLFPSEPQEIYFNTQKLGDALDTRRR